MIEHFSYLRVEIIYDAPIPKVLMECGCSPKEVSKRHRSDDGMGWHHDANGHGGTLSW